MFCPKCDHEQTSSVECEKCGLIFERYRMVQEQKKDREQQQETSVEKPALGMKILRVIVLIVAVAGTTYYFTAGRSQQESGAPVARAVVQQKNSPTVEVQTQGKAVARPQGVAARAVPKGNPIARARNATVSIETPWGTGAGFFINENYIVTNKHVVQFDEEKQKEFKRKVETGRKLIQLERQKIRELKKKYRELGKGPTKSQIAIIIENRQQELEKVLPRYNMMEERLARIEKGMSPSDIKIIFADGSEYVANYLLMSENHDLALMSLSGGEWAHLDRPPGNRRIQQGDKVFAVGSPVGLRHSVTSGIISGFQRQIKTGEVYLQTDAAINPGNSGGPLVDEAGYVQGVTTMIMKNTEGIGFAIPIQVVFDEFGATLD